MKTTEYWIQSKRGNEWCDMSRKASAQKANFIEWVKEIQLDYFKAGMTEAGKIATRMPIRYDTASLIPFRIQFEIFRARDAKTSL